MGDLDGNHKVWQSVELHWASVLGVHYKSAGGETFEKKVASVKK